MSETKEIPGAKKVQTERDCRCTECGHVGKAFFIVDDALKTWRDQIIAAAYAIGRGDQEHDVPEDEGLAMLTSVTLDSLENPSTEAAALRSSLKEARDLLDGARPPLYVFLVAGKDSADEWIIRRDAFLAGSTQGAPAGSNGGGT